MKHYKKFYEIGSNRYYSIVADDEMYIASESFLRLGKKTLFNRHNELNTGFKVLKFNAPMVKLFIALDELKPKKKQRYESEDLLIYDKIDNKELKQQIKNEYLKAYDEEVESAKQLRKELQKSGDTKAIEACENYLDKLESLDLMHGIDLNSPEHTGCLIIKTMLREGLEHLYTEPVNAFTKNVYLYEQDEFANLTIYKLTTIKNVVKSIDTFIYDKKLVENLFKTLYEKGW